MFALAQTLHGFGISRVTSEVKSTQTTNRNDGSTPQQIDHGIQRSSPIAVDMSRVHSFQPDRRPTGGTGNRLCMKATVSRIPILFTTEFAHREVSHRRVNTIVGNLFHDGESWS